MTAKQLDDCITTTVRSYSAQPNVGPRAVCKRLIIMIEAAGGVITFKELNNDDPAATPLSDYAVCCEVLQNGASPMFLAWGPVGSMPAIKATSDEEAQSKAEQYIHETIGFNAKILIRECMRL